MSLRLVNKINRQFIKNVFRPTSTCKGAADVEQKQEDVNPKTKEVSGPSVQYQVCRPRTTPVKSFHIGARNEADAAKQYAALHHLQPALLPEYYTPPLEIHSYMYSEPFSEAEKKSTQKQRFEDSKTYLNVTLPLKGPKLSSPFPSPVKVMESNTISDQEKAEHMLAEAKVCKGASLKQSRRYNPLKLVPSYRTFTTDHDESSGNKKGCPKLGGQSGRTDKYCPRFKTAKCKVPESITCKRKKGKMECQKKLAPYPSYSESCHQEIIEKPSECKICPWKPEEHPTFKPPSKNFHSSSALLVPKRKHTCDRPSDRKSLCHTKDKKKTKDSLEKRHQHKEHHDHHRRGPQKSNEHSSKPDGQKVADGLATGRTLWLDSVKQGTASPALSSFTHLDLFTVNDNNMLFTDTDKPCTKFPFKSEDFPLERKRTIKKVHQKGHQCPKKKTLPAIEDCGEEEEAATNTDKCKKMERVGLDILLQHRMLAGKKKDRDVTKCPRVDLGICKEEGHEENADPCGRKHKGKPLVCPTDLLKKQVRKPTPKKTSELVTSIPTTSPLAATTSKATSL